MLIYIFFCNKYHIQSRVNSKESILLFKWIGNNIVVYLMYLYILLQLNKSLLDRRIHKTPQCFCRPCSNHKRLDLLRIHWCPGHSFCLSSQLYKHTHWQCHTHQLLVHTDTLSYSFYRNRVIHTLKISVNVKSLCTEKMLKMSHKWKKKKLSF